MPHNIYISNIKSGYNVLGLRLTLTHDLVDGSRFTPLSTWLTNRQIQQEWPKVD